MQLISAERLTHGRSTQNMAQQQVAVGQPFGGVPEPEYPDPAACAAARAFIAQISWNVVGTDGPIEEYASGSIVLAAGSALNVDPGFLP